MQPEPKSELNGLVVPTHEAPTKRPSGPAAAAAAGGGRSTHLHGAPLVLRQRRRAHDQSRYLPLSCQIFGPDTRVEPGSKSGIHDPVTNNRRVRVPLRGSGGRVAGDSNICDDQGVGRNGFQHQDNTRNEPPPHQTKTPKARQEPPKQDKKHKKQNKKHQKKSACARISIFVG